MQVIICCLVSTIFLKETITSPSWSANLQFVALHKVYRFFSLSVNSNSSFLTSIAFFLPHLHGRFAHWLTCIAWVFISFFPQTQSSLWLDSLIAFSSTLLFSFLSVCCLWADLLPSASPCGLLLSLSATWFICCFFTLQGHKSSLVFVVFDLHLDSCLLFIWHVVSTVLNK